LQQKCVPIFSTNLFETFLILRRIQWDIIIHVLRLSGTVLDILSNFNKLWIFPTEFWEVLKHISWKSVHWESQTDGRMYRQTWHDMTKLTVATALWMCLKKMLTKMWHAFLSSWQYAGNISITAPIWYLLVTALFLMLSFLFQLVWHQRVFSIISHSYECGKEHWQGIVHTSLYYLQQDFIIYKIINKA